MQIQSRYCHNLYCWQQGIACEHTKDTIPNHDVEVLATVSPGPHFLEVVCPIDCTNANSDDPIDV